MKVVRRTSSLLAAGSLVIATGCAVRLDRSEHYFGPTFYRHADGAKADVIETIHVGLAGEAGTQWGGMLGYARRVAVASVSPEGPSGSHGPWASVLPIAFGGGENAWKLSLLHLSRADAPAPTFVRRITSGLRAGVGPEVRSMSLGFTSSTVLTPGDDVFVRLCFRTDDPLHTQLAVWPHTARDAATLARALEEECP